VTAGRYATDRDTLGPGERVALAAALAGVGAAGVVAVLHGQDAAANAAVTDAAAGPGGLAGILGRTGSPLPVAVAYFWSVGGLALLAALAVVLVTWTACRFTEDLRGPFADVFRGVVVIGAACGIVALVAVDVRTALVLALAVTAWHDLQDFTLRGMVQSGFYGGLVLAAAVLVQPTAVCWALALAGACYLLPGSERPRGERAAGALVVAFPAVAIACMWALVRLLLGGTWNIEVPSLHPTAFAAAAAAGMLLWLSLARTGRSGAGAATIPVLLAGGVGLLGPGLMTVAIPVAAGLSVIALTVAAHWAAVRVTVVGVAATTAMLGSVSTVVTGTAGAATTARPSAPHVVTAHVVVTVPAAATAGSVGSGAPQGRSPEGT
jgi:hypothetical protein